VNKQNALTQCCEMNLATFPPRFDPRQGHIQTGSVAHPAYPVGNGGCFHGSKTAGV